VKTAFIEKGSPQQNPFLERFSGTMRDELLNGEEFDSLLEARVVIANWVDGYNRERPHRGLGMMTPLQYARGVQKLGRSNPIRRISSEIEWGVSTPMLSIEVGSYQQRFVTHLLPRPHVASAAKNWAAISRSRSPAAAPRPRTR
jgi:Integrase core domain